MDRTLFEYSDESLRVVRVTLSDGTVLEGDAIPQLEHLEPSEWQVSSVQAEKKRIAAKAQAIVLDAIKRKLTMDDVAVLIGRLIQGERIDGFQIALFVLVGIRLQAKLQQSRGGSKAKKPPAVIAAVEEMLRTKQSTKAIVARVEQMGETFSRESIAKRRKKLSTK